MSSRRLALTLAVAVALLVSACGGSSSPAAAPATTVAPTTAAPSPAPTTTTTSTAPPTATGAAVPSAGCDGAAGAPTVDEKVTIDVAGAERWFLQTIPPAPAATPLPIVVDFHGLSEGATIHAKMTEFSALGTKDHFVVLTPNGLGTPVGWAAQTDTDPHGDRAFTAAMLEKIEQEHCIDVSRVYATGLSNGSFMSSSVACAMADRFAAIAPVSGLQYLKPCQTERPVPVLTFHGTGDPILLFNGGVDGDYLGQVLGGKPATGTTEPRPYDIDGEGYPATVRQWAEHNGCDPEPTDTKVSATVIHRVYDCPADGAVEFYIIIGGGHSWPGSEFSKSIESIVGPTTFDIDATPLIWAFFQRFRLPAEYTGG